MVKLGKGEQEIIFILSFLQLGFLLTSYIESLNNDINLEYTWEGIFTSNNNNSSLFWLIIDKFE